MADSVPTAMANEVNPIVRWPRGTPRKEYPCGYSIKKWVADQVARHDPPLEVGGADWEKYHFKLFRQARDVAFPCGDYFTATDGNTPDLHPFIALASNKGQGLPQMPRQDMVEKMQRFLGTDEPPKWFKRYNRECVTRRNRSPSVDSSANLLLQNLDICGV